MSNQIFFTPGPAQKFYSYEQHLKNALKKDIPSISHRSNDFQNIFQETVENIKTLLGIPSEYYIFFTSSATEIWERITQNLIIESSHHFVNGSFSKRFYEITKAYQLKSTVTEAGFGEAFDLGIPVTAELIAITQNETSIGYNFPNDEITHVIESKPTGALVAVDVVSCAPAVALDYSTIDTAYFSVQKSFGLPAGLGVWIVNDKCIEKAEFKEKSGMITGSYHSIGQLKKYADKYQTPETPNVLNIYLLGKVAQDMLYRGAKQIQNDTIYKSTILYQTMNELDWIEPFIGEKKYRSKTVGVGKLMDKSSVEIINKMKEKKMIVGPGYGKFKNEHIRIANFPTHSKEQMELLVDILKTL